MSIHQSLPDKKKRTHGNHGFLVGHVLATMGLEALAAVDGTAFGGLEGNLGHAAALVADDFEHLAGVPASVTAGSTASGATSGLILKAFLGEERLLVGGEDEFLAAVFAHESFVLIHGMAS
jgi:hypothetical protein